MWAQYCVAIFALIVVSTSADVVAKVPTSITDSLGSSNLSNVTDSQDLISKKEIELPDRRAANPFEEDDDENSTENSDDDKLFYEDSVSKEDSTEGDSDGGDDKDGDDDDKDGDDNEKPKNEVKSGKSSDGKMPEFRHCGGNSVRLHVSKFPDPLLLRTGEKLNVAFTATISEKLPEPIYARISIRKKVLGLWNRIPCVGRVGSCEYEVTCDKIRKQYGGKLNRPCPPEIGTSEREFTFTMPRIPRIVRSFASGHYKIQAKLFTKKRGKGELLACSETRVRVKT